MADQGTWDPERLTLGQAANRVNSLTDTYSKERVRLEESFTRLLLPAAISIAALLTKGVFASEFFYYALFLTCFFGFYTMQIAYDLYQSERLLENARRVQDAIYQKSASKASASLKKTFCELELKRYAKMESAVGRQHYIIPTGKLLTSLFLTAFVILIVWLSKG